MHRDSQTVEIATFRGEAYGGDAHKPEQVWYCDDLEADLSRRDFTVNAMALDQSGNVYDYHGGRQDLQQKILRTVGDAPARYQEDALRMYRACRFVGQLGFDYVQRQGAARHLDSRRRRITCRRATAFLLAAVPGYHWNVCGQSWISCCSANGPARD